ncbi:MAG: LPS assembly lipoprotein LptE [Bacteroidota bacterium]
MRYFILLLLIGSAAVASGCYSLSGISIDPETNTYYVEPFKNNARNVVPSLAQILTEDLKEKIRLESRLLYVDRDPDIEFKGTVVDYRVTSEAPEPGETTAINRLTIVTSIEYINTKNEDKNWKKNFPFFFDFASNVDLSNIQDEAIESISDQLMEDIFNEAFTDW